jgi:hypothetical protein
MEHYAAPLQQVLNDSGQNETTVLSELIRKNMEGSFELPQYIRINHMRISLKEGLEYLSSTLPAEHVAIARDGTIPSLVMLIPKDDSRGCRNRLSGTDPMVMNGSLIIQDKVVLNPHCR